MHAKRTDFTFNWQQSIPTDMKEGYLSKWELYIVLLLDSVHFHVFLKMNNPLLAKKLIQLFPLKKRNKEYIQSKVASKQSFFNIWNKCHLIHVWGEKMGLSCRLWSHSQKWKGQRESDFLCRTRQPGWYCHNCHGFWHDHFLPVTPVLFLFLAKSSSVFQAFNMWLPS